MENKIFDYDKAIAVRGKLTNDIKAEYKSIRISTLGGKENTSIMITLSLDKKENWAYGILENSRYYHFSIEKNGVVENFTSSYKLKRIRKKRVKSLSEAVAYINEKINLEV